MGNEHSKHHHHHKPQNEDTNENKSVEGQDVENNIVHSRTTNVEKETRTGEHQRWYSPKYETPHIVLEDVVVQSQSDTYQEVIPEEFKAMSFLSMGMPIEKYMWLYNKICKLSNEQLSLDYTLLSGKYIWLPVELPPNEIVYDDVKCYIYSKQQTDTIAIGNLVDVLTCLKSNLIGHGLFTARVFRNHNNHTMLILLLTGFQMVDLTEEKLSVPSKHYNSLA